MRILSVFPENYFYELNHNILHLTHSFIVIPLFRKEFSMQGLFIYIQMFTYNLYG